MLHLSSLLLSFRLATSMVMAAMKVPLLIYFNQLTYSERRKALSNRFYNAARFDSREINRPEPPL